MHKALGVCFTLVTLVSHAQLDHSAKQMFINNGADRALILNDTIIFMPDPHTKVFFIGDDLKKMAQIKS